MITTRKKITRIIAGLAALALAGGGLAACAKGDTAGKTGGGAEAAGTLEVWDYLGQGVSNDAMVAVVKAFEAKYPDIKVKRTSFAFADLAKSIVQGGVGGAVPDVAIVDVVDNQNFGALGLLKDITTEFGSKSADYYPGPWSATQLEGKTYGLPLNSNNLAVYYNKDMFAKAGVNVPTTWEELKTAAKKLATDGASGLAISAVKNEQGTFQVLPFVWQTGGDLDNYAESGAKALEYLKSMIDDGGMSAAVVNYSQEDARTQFTAGKVAMMINGPWELNNLKDLGFDWAVAPLPKGKRAATGLGGENMVVFKEAKNAAAAMKFIEFLGSSEGVKIYCEISGQLPARPNLAGTLETSADPNLQVFENQLGDARARAYGGKYNEISEAVQLSIQEALTGAKTPTDAAKSAAETITGLLPKK